MSTIYVFTACGIYFKIIKHKKTSVDVFNTGLNAAKERIRAKEIPRMHYEETKRWEKRERVRDREDGKDNLIGVLGEREMGRGNI